MKCLNCAAENEAGAIYCAYCRSELPRPRMNNSNSTSTVTNNYYYSNPPATVAAPLEQQQQIRQKPVQAVIPEKVPSLPAGKRAVSALFLILGIVTSLISLFFVTGVLAFWSMKDTAPAIITAIMAIVFLAVSILLFRTSRKRSK